jgi:Nif-specific regulatory protein
MVMLRIMAENTVHQSRTLSALIEVSRCISSSLDYQEIAYQCLNSLSENLDLDKLALWMPSSEEMNMLQVHVGVGWKEQEWNDLDLENSSHPAVKVFASGMPLAVPDAGSIEELYLPDNPMGGVTGYIAVPVLVNRISIGVLTAYRVYHRTMLDQDVNVMKIVASILSQTLKLAEYVEATNEKLKTENQELHAALSEKFRMENMVSQSTNMNQMLEMVQRVANTEATVLLRGESGTGKTMIAKGIHQASSRSRAPLIIVNCAAIPENLIESELFGHEKGAFTGAVKSREGKFQAAEGGTLFLDEIGELSIDLQAKILRVIQDGEYERVGSNETLTSNARLVCATNSHLEERVQNKSFREDLYYRLMVVPIHLPSLKNRREDILPLVDHFLRVYNEKYGKSVSISSSGLVFLEEHEWPGNVRELENTIERTVILAAEEVVPKEGIPLLAVSQGPIVEEPSLSLASSKPKPKRNLYERVPLREEQIRKALEEAVGIQTLAARKLGVSLRQLRYAVNKYEINIKEYKYI